MFYYFNLTFSLHLNYKYLKLKENSMNGEDFEQKIKKYHFRLELVRSIAPIVIITLQCIILYKVFKG